MNPPAEAGPSIEQITVSCYRVPTETPESDGTLHWEHTTLVLVEAAAGGKDGLGYSYADVATGKLIESLLSDVVKRRNAFGISAGLASHRWRFRRLITRSGI